MTTPSKPNADYDAAVSKLIEKAHACGVLEVQVYSRGRTRIQVTLTPPSAIDGQPTMKPYTSGQLEHSLAKA